MMNGVEYVPAKFQWQDGWTLFIPVGSPDPTIPAQLKKLLLNLEWRYKYEQI